MEEEKGDLILLPIAKKEAESYFTDDLKNYLNKRRITMQFLLDAKEEDKEAYIKVVHNCNVFIKEILYL
jgi:hypothetical protein